MATWEDGPTMTPATEDAGRWRSVKEAPWARRARRRAAVSSLEGLVARLQQRLDGICGTSPHAAEVEARQRSMRPELEAVPGDDRLRRNAGAHALMGSGFDPEERRHATCCERARGSKGDAEYTFNAD